MSPAEQNLRDHQQQLDADGIMVGVSRQAVDEVLAELAELREALTRIRDCDWVITLPDRMDAVRDIARAALLPEERK